MENQNDTANQASEVATAAKSLIETKNLAKTFKLGKTRVEAVKDVSLSISSGEFVALLGPSGSGKSTLMNLIGGLDKPSQGSVIVDGQDLRKLSDRKLSTYRGQKVGFVFQSFYLQPFLDIKTNIEVPAMFAGIKKAERAKRSTEVAEAVGLTDRLKHKPSQLSGGQIQRAAIARALVNRPKILLADEPTGNLDHDNGLAIFDLFEKIRRELGTTTIVVTHDEELARKADRIIRINDGETE